jgi:hypothetical protein
LTSPGRDRSWPGAYLASPSPSLCPPDPSPAARFGSTACLILGRVRVVSAVSWGCACPARPGCRLCFRFRNLSGFGCVVSSARVTVVGSQVALRFRGSGGQGADGGLPASRPPHLQLVGRDVKETLSLEFAAAAARAAWLLWGSAAGSSRGSGAGSSPLRPRPTLRRCRADRRRL